MQSRPILVLGALGQVAKAFAHIKTFRHNPIFCRGRPEADITNFANLKYLVETLRPRLVINTAAYTAVDQAETDQASAFSVNADGARFVAQVCCDHQVPLVHLSTDYVFSGNQTSPYHETDTVSPLNVYGHSKAAGEEAIRQVWPMHIILRTSWIYSLEGHNFLKTMLRLAEERNEISVVNDQHGTPTWSGDLVVSISEIVTRILDEPSSIPWGTYHLTNQGDTTWYGFAGEIFRIRSNQRKKIPILKPIRSSDYPSKAQRPFYTVLDTSKIERAFGLRMPEWQASLSKCMTFLSHN